MREQLPRLAAWQRRGEPFALATVVATSSSAPRPPGAALGLSADGEVVGSVSGGCVEGDVVEVAREVLRTGQPRRRHYGIADADAIAVGLTCGGEIDVFIGLVDPGSADLDRIQADVAEGRPVGLATIVDAPDERLLGRLITVDDGGPRTTCETRLDQAVAEAACGLLAHGRSAMVRLGPDGERLGDEVAVFVHSFAPPPRMLVFGATDFARATAGVGRHLGYHVTVCDAREVFTTRERFPDADEVVVQWPHRYLAETTVDERTVICVLTHDPKFDVPLLEAALRTDAAYVGAMGSRRTDRERRRLLRERGLGDAALSRLRSPVGLDLGAMTPEETSVSIAAEMILELRGGSARPLREVDGPIHRIPAPPLAATDGG